MKRLAFLFAVLLGCFVIYSPAQSGRRIKTAPTPAPTPAADSPAEYSESKPNDGPTYSTGRSKDKRAKNEPTPAPAQPAPDTTASSGDDDVVKVSTDLVTIPVSVYERSGVYVGDLRQADFKIFEDGKEQQVAYFGTQDQPFSVVLLIDTSPSTTYKIEDIRNAAKAFVDQLSPEDKVMVISFDYGVHVHTEFTTDRQQIYRAINKADFGDGTSLYEAVDTALRKKLSKIEGRKAIVLFTDGVDTTSRGANYDNTLALAEESDSVVFPIYYNTYFDMRGIGSGGVMSAPPTLGLPKVYGQPTSEDYTHGRVYLQELARVTGGQMYRPESTTGGLTTAFEGIAQELRSQYSIGYYPQQPGTPGQRKQIKVRVNRPQVAVRARDSYIVGQKGPGLSGK